MPGGHIFNKDGTRMITRSSPLSPTSGPAIVSSQKSSSTNTGSGVQTETLSGVVPNAVRKKKKKNRNKGLHAQQQTINQQGYHDEHDYHHDHDHIGHHHHHHEHDHATNFTHQHSHIHSHHNDSLYHHNIPSLHPKHLNIRSNSNNIPPPPPPPPPREATKEYEEALRASLEQYESAEYPELDADGEAYFSGDSNRYIDPEEQFPTGANIEGQPGMGKKKNKKKKKKSAPLDETSFFNTNQRSHEQSTTTAPKNKDRIWNTSTAEERERIKDFWLSLKEDERRSLVKVEKEAVLKKMKEQQKHSCSCSVCGRKRTAIEEELEVLYDAYYNELEQYANQQHIRCGSSVLSGSTASLPGSFTNSPAKGLPSQHRRIEELPDLEEDDEEPYDDEEEDDDEEEEEEEEEGDDGYEDASEDEEQDARQDFFNFGNSLTVQGGILTVADDLLKNDGKKFIEMMEQLAERRMAREEEASQQAAHILNGGTLSLPGHNHSHTHVNGQSEYDDEEDEEEYDEDDEDYDEEEDEEGVTMTEEQRMEEGRRMFQIFAARMFEQRVLSAYRERVAQERQQKLLEELAEEDRMKEEQKVKKVKDKEKKKDKKRLQKQQKEEERLRREIEKADEEAAQKVLEEKKLEENKRRKEEQRLKREAEKKAQEEDRSRREEEKKRRLQEEREREVEKERKRKEHQEKERKKKEEQMKKQKEEKDAKEKQRKEREDREKKENSNKKLSSGRDGLSRTDDTVSVHDVHQSYTNTKNKNSFNQAQISASVTALPNIISPRLAVTTPALPKASPTGKGRSSAQTSAISSPTTTHVDARINKAMSPAASIVSSVNTNPHNSNKKASQFAPPLIHTQPPLQFSQPHFHPHHLLPHGGGPPLMPTESFSPSPIGMNGPPGQPPFMSNMPSRTLGNGTGMFTAPLPGQAAFSQPAFRGFPNTSSINMPMPPLSGLRGFPPSGRGFMNEMPPVPQGMQGAPSFQPPTSQFVSRPESLHTRQASGGFDETVSMATPKPIHRPTPIQRPASIAANGTRASIEELSTSLGSSALLGDDEPEESGSHVESNTTSRRGSSVLSRSIFGVPPLQSPFLPIGKDIGNGAFGLNPIHSTTWGAPSPLPPLGSLPNGGWGSSPGWSIPENEAARVNYNRRGQTRLDYVRTLACQLCRDLGTREPDGFVDLISLHKAMNSANHPTIAGEVDLDELKTASEIEGDLQNGGGTFQTKRLDHNRVLLRFDLENDFGGYGRKRSSVGSQPHSVGEIGSPTSTSPFSFARHVPPGIASVAPHGHM